MSDEPLSRPDRGFEVNSALLAEFPDQFAAALALYDHCRVTRPPHPPSDDVVGEMLMWIYSRSSKTFAASLRLAAAGYGEQAGMLNRSLFEDVVLAHWATKNPETVVPLLRDHERWTREKWRQAVEKHRLDWPVDQPLDPDEFSRLGGIFRGGTWAGKNLYELVAEIEDMWVEGTDRNLLWQHHDLVNAHNISMDHQTAIGLRLAGTRTEDGRQFLPGPSNTHIHGALHGAFWSYANLAGLVLQGDQKAGLDEVYSTHMEAFIVFRYIEPEVA